MASACGFPDDVISDANRIFESLVPKIRHTSLVPDKSAGPPHEALLSKLLSVHGSSLDDVRVFIQLHFVRAAL